MTRILLFTKTTGYRHESMQAGIDLITESATADGVGIDHTEESSVFTAENLARYDAVVWLQVSGDVLEGPERIAFVNFLKAGGGFAAIHGPADAEWSWPEYDDIVGARFLFHPLNYLVQPAAVHVQGGAHGSTASIPEPWHWTEEWYAFKRNPRGVKTILLTVDEATYDAETHPMGADHPIAWFGEYGAGRTWYTSLGHQVEAYTDPVFRSHVWGGITSVFAS
jgi:type 1 glutamine amidotransferase